MIKYLCGDDYKYKWEDGLADLYNSIDEIKNEKPCWGECGIVSLELDESGNEIWHRWIVKQDLCYDRSSG